MRRRRATSLGAGARGCGPHQTKVKATTPRSLEKVRREMSHLFVVLCRPGNFCVKSPQLAQLSLIILAHSSQLRCRDFKGETPRRERVVGSPLQSPTQNIRAPAFRRCAVPCREFNSPPVGALAPVENCAKDENLLGRDLRSGHRALPLQGTRINSQSRAQGF